jgi:subtilisin-like proprotein convertase family protein
MLDGSVTDLVEATSLGFRQDHIDVYSSSWGPDDDGKTLDGPGVLAQKAFLQGISTGRNGKGSIFVWASGNGGTAHDSCSCDGYVISPYTIGIGAATEEGKKPWYVEECPAQMAVTPSSGSFKHRKIITPDLRHKCTTSHTGTSAAAPLAAAVIALGLQANPSLTWRDVQHIIVITSKKEHLTSNWQTNAAGFHFSHQFGFGMMDAAAIVNRAIDWVSVPERINCSVAPKLLNSGGTLHLTVDSGCRVTYAEHVVVNLSISLHHGRRGDIHISLISPHGTRSELLPKRSRDSQTKSIINWPFMTVASWGEDPKGKWSLQVVADGGSKAEITSVQLVVFGTEGTPIGVQRITRQCHKSCKGKCSGPQATACDDCTQYRVYESRECVESCPPATFSSESVCWPCPNGCSMCDRDRCTECFSGLSLLTNGSCSCSQEQYKTVDNNKVTCVSCDEVCLSCNGSGPGNCLACKPSFSSVSGTCVRTDLISSYELSSHLLSASSVVLESTQSSSASSLPSLVSSPIPSLTSADHVKESTSTTSTEDVTTSTEDATASTEDTSAISITSSVLLTSESAGGGHPVDLSPEGSPLAMGAVVVLLGCVIIGATVGVVIVIIFKVGRTKYRRYKPIKEEQGYWDSDEELIYKQ